MRPALLNPLFAPVTSLGGVGPKQDKLLRYLLDRSETPRLVDLLLHLPAPPRGAREKKTWKPGIKPGMTGGNSPRFLSCAPACSIRCLLP